MKRIWLQSYPPGTPPEIEAHAFSSLTELFDQNCARFRDKPAFSNMGVSLNYRDIERLSRNFGAYMQHEAGIAKGARIALVLPNLLQYPVALLGALRAGLVSTRCSPRCSLRRASTPCVP